MEFLGLRRVSLPRSGWSPPPAVAAQALAGEPVGAVLAKLEGVRSLAGDARQLRSAEAGSACATRYVQKGTMEGETKHF